MKFAIAIGTWIIGGGRLLGRWLNIRDWWVVVAGKGRVWMGSMGMGMCMRRGIRGRGLGLWRGGRHIGKGGSEGRGQQERRVCQVSSGGGVRVRACVRCVRGACLLACVLVAYAVVLSISANQQSVIVVVVVVVVDEVLVGVV